MDRIKELTISRRQELKRYKKLANQYLSKNKELKDLHKNKWEHRVYEKNIKKLKEIIYEINQESKDSSIENFVLNVLMIDKRMKSNEKTLIDISGLRETCNNIKSELKEFNIIRYSPSYSVIHDLYWIEDGTVGDQKDIILGRKTPEIYGQYLQSKIDKIKKEVLPFLESKKELIPSTRILRTAIENLDQNKYAAANILIITIIEGLVRIICKRIYSNQNPKLSEKDIEHYIYHEFTSLESLITKGDFKPNYDITIVDGYLLNQHVISDELDKIEKEFDKFKKKSNWVKENIKNELDEWIQLANKMDSENDKEQLKKKINEFQDKLGEGPMSRNDSRKISIKPSGTLRNSIINGIYHPV